MGKQTHSFPLSGDGLSPDRSPNLYSGGSMSPKKPMVPCRYGSCPELVPPGGIFCDRHSVPGSRPGLKPCRAPKCPTLVVPGTDPYCPAHRRTRNQAYDKTRPTAGDRGYGERWRRYRVFYLKRHPICVCGCGRPARVVDHIEPVTGPQDPKFWDPTNHQALTVQCHNRKTAQDGRRSGRGTNGNASVHR